MMTGACRRSHLANIFMPPIILDGGLASELERRGADLRDPLWSGKLLYDNPDLIRQVHEDYFAAGADVGTSASYQASFLGFARRGLTPKQAADLMRFSVRLVREARDRVKPSGKIAASVGCYGAFLADGSEYRGDYDLSVDDLIEWHRPRMETLLDESPDYLACETIPCLAEAEALARLTDEYATPAWISFACREGHLASGESLAEAAVIAAGAKNVIAVGVNCVPPETVNELLRILRPLTATPLIAYPNSGGTWNASTKSWDGGTPFDWGAAAIGWRDTGAAYLGGCCRTMPDTIRAIAAALRAT